MLFETSMNMKAHGHVSVIVAKKETQGTLYVIYRKWKVANFNPLYLLSYLANFTKFLALCILSPTYTLLHYLTIKSENWVSGA